MNDMQCHWCLAHTNEVEEEIEFKCQQNLGEDIVYWTKYKSGWSENRLGSNMFYACPNHETEEGEAEPKAIN